MALGGIFTKGISFFLRLIELCCAAIILGIFSYFLATLHNHELHISTTIRAVEGISGAGVVYTLFALLLVCFLGGIAFLSIFAMILDIAFAGAFAYVAYANREGRHSCRGNVDTFFGSGNTYSSNKVTAPSGGITILPSLRTACKLETACFAIAIVAAVFFLLSALLEPFMIRHHKKEKAFGPSPNNGYTAGSPKRKFWQRKPKRDVEAGEKGDALPAHQTPADFRTSYATESTAIGHEPVYNKYEHDHTHVAGGAAAPQTTGTTDGYQTSTTTHTGGYQPYRTENANGTY